MAGLESRYATGLTDPAYIAVAVTPGASALAGGPTRGLYVGADGDVEVTMLGDDNDVTFVGVVAGTILPVRATHVLTAAGGSVVALY